jgi:hypothetical protein
VLYTLSFPWLYHDACLSEENNTREIQWKNALARWDLMTGRTSTSIRTSQDSASSIRAQWLLGTPLALWRSGCWLHPNKMPCKVSPC